VAATPVRWAANGHCYEVEAPEIWTDARTQSLARGGYLVTITSQDENSFVRNLIFSAGLWLGATDIGYATGDYHWIDGPEAGQPVSNYYVNWRPTEPNDQGGIEHYAEMLSTGQWNDNSLISLSFATEFAGTYFVL